ncbi:MAG TPA: amidohydrolase [Candidatus Cloacimonadota bacterium]|nr:amidohydrolase [Candidatus Cloacimonadota bacterium]
MKTLVYNGIINSMQKENDIYQAMLVENGKIIELYKDSVPSIDCEKKDLNGLYVFPGFIDTHTHSFEGGLYSHSIDLSKATSVTEILQLIDAEYRKAKTGSKDHLDAFRFDENKIIEKRFPSRDELDKVCPDLPLILRRIDGHSCAVNSRALDQFSLANSNKINSSAQLKDVFSGELNDEIVHWFLQNCTEEEILQAYHTAAETAVKNGITTVHTMVGDAQNSIMHYNFLKEYLRQFPVEFILYPQSFNLKAALDAGADRIGGCILADGSLGSYTAALKQPYLGNDNNCGILYHSDEFWQDFIIKVTEHNLQVAVHCIGDKAIEQINRAYDLAYKKHPNDLRHELIHCEMTPDYLVEQIIASNAVPVMQPAFDLYWGGSDGYYAQVLGMERSQKMNRFNTFFHSGVTITGGSDWYITELDALQGIRSAVNHHNSKEKITAWQAILMYTKNAAWLSHDENRIGILKAGYDADFVCLNNNLLDPEQIYSAQIIATYKKGKPVFSHA